MNETDMCVFKERFFLKYLFNNKLLIFLLYAKPFYSINKVRKCNIWISNTSYIFDYNSISFHDNQQYFGIKLKRTFLTKYIKLQVPAVFCSDNNQ